MEAFNTKRHSLILFARVFFLILLFLLAGLCTFFLSARLAPEVVDAAAHPPLVILDAGHGGEDGGAVGVNGALEKDINLAMVNELASLLRDAGVEVVLTRTGDKLLYGEGEDIPGERKKNDLKNRLAVAEANPDAIFVSIHMNTFSVAKYSGLQVYYADTEGSQALASAIQSSVQRDVQQGNRRLPHTASSSIFLLYHAVGTSVLVECGFLSNPEECALLSQKDYQSRLCFSIFCGMMEYIESKGGTKP
jgi:N-acetylmuramoyl-L-alanine amidase